MGSHCPEVVKWCRRTDLDTADVSPGAAAAFARSVPGQGLEKQIVHVPLYLFY